MKSFLNNIRRNSIFALIAFVCVGLLLVIFPQKVANVAGYLAGSLGVFFGATKIIAYFSKSESEKRVTVFGLALGIIFALAGIYVIVRPQIVSDFIVSVFGVVVMVDGISKMRSSLNLKRSGMKNYLAIFVTAAVELLLGIVFIINPGLSLNTMLRIIGVVLVAMGVSNLVTFVGVTKEYKTIINKNGEIEGDGKVVSSEEEK